MACGLAQQSNLFISPTFCFLAFFLSPAHVDPCGWLDLPESLKLFHTPPSLLPSLSLSLCVAGLFSFFFSYSPADESECLEFNPFLVLGHFLWSTLFCPLKTLLSTPSGEGIYFKGSCKIGFFSALLLLCCCFCLFGRKQIVKRMGT